jgi:ribosomal protein L16 Arg81 hydroxylase
MHGAKRWLLYPEEPPHFDANTTSIKWLRDVYPHLLPWDLPWECVIEPGDLLYFPRDWYHAIVNLGESVVFMSTFL